MSLQVRCLSRQSMQKMSKHFLFFFGVRVRSQRQHIIKITRTKKTDEDGRDSRMQCVFAGETNFWDHGATPKCRARWSALAFGKDRLENGPRWTKIGFLQFYFRELQGRSLVNSNTIQEMHLRGRGQRKAKTHLFDDLMFLSADGRAIFDSNGITLRK